MCSHFKQITTPGFFNIKLGKKRNITEFIDPSPRQQFNKVNYVNND